MDNAGGVLKSKTDVVRIVTMEYTDNKSEAEYLRQKAERLLKTGSKPDSHLSESDSLKLIHELQVHQIELELLNEELLLANERAEIAAKTAETAAERYTELYDFAPSGYFTLSKEGNIIELNLIGARMLGYERSLLKNSRFGLFVTAETKPLFNTFLKNVFSSKTRETCEAILSANGALPIDVHIEGIVSETGEQCIATVVNITDIKRAEEVLRQSEARHSAEESAKKWQTTFDGIRDSVLLLDTNGIILQANKASRSIFGKKEEEILGRHCYEIVHKSDCRIDDCPFIRTKLSRQREAKLLAVDGRWLDMIVDPVLDEHNQVTGAVHIISDVTERKQTEAASCENEELINQFLKNAPIYIFFKDENARLIRLSSNYEQMLNMPIKDIIGKNMDELFPSELANSMVEDDKSVLQGGRMITVEEEFNGHYYTTTKFPINIDGKPRYLAGFTFDITERKKAEEAIRESESKHSLMIASISDVIVIIDTDGIMKYKSPNIEKCFGWKLREIVGTNGWSMIHPDDLERMQQEFYLLLQENNSVKTFECRYRCKDGSYKPIEITANNLTNDPVIGGIIMNYRDITERKQAEEKIIKVNKELEKLNTEKDKLFSIIAHDLRSPFTGLLGLSEIMASESNDLSSSDIALYSKALHRSIGNVYQLLENLLEWAQFQKGSIAFTPVELCIRDVFLESEEYIKQRAMQKGITIIKEIPETIQVYADDKMINSVLRNLLSNAVKFSSKDGKVVGRAIERKGGMVEISVTDTGVGIPKNILEKLFKLGENVGTDGTDGEPSTGLGLLLCKEFVEQNGGNIWVESEEGKGSTFYFTLLSKNNRNI